MGIVRLPFDTMLVIETEPPGAEEGDTAMVLRDDAWEWCVENDIPLPRISTCPPYRTCVEGPALQGGDVSTPTPLPERSANV